MTETLIVVRAPNWLGDTVMALPALWAIRAGWPDARIAVVGPWVGVLSGQGVADLVVAYPRDHLRRRAVDRVLAIERPDLAVLLPNSLAAAVAARRWRARRRLGFATDARAVLLTDALPPPDPRRHQVDEYLELAERAGGRPGDDRPRWKRRADPAADLEVARLLEEAGVPGARNGEGAPRPVVGLHLGAAGGAAKRWEPERFGELGAALSRGGATPLLLGGPDDLDAAARAVAGAGHPLASLVGRDRPDLLPSVLAGLACLVSGDTGVAHLAAALDVATVTLFGPTDARRTAPRGPRARVIDRGVPCAPCFLRECPIDHPCLRGVGAAAVAECVLEAVA
ncbi:MAG TPA: glycosyltransferase family 9 protein [Candidatus Binatia bacterium]|nr:glycosyltransferase family 9 protein [Candidatus Binatia bacterium]